MGVKGLWKLLEPVGRPITLESLENKILAVDASILLNQSLKGMRDRDGNLVPNAHLVGLFHRICKLLFYRIKPVFVFDGGVPTLKKKTMDARKERKRKASSVSSKTAERIVKNLLKGKAIEAVTGMKSELALRSNSPREPDIFELPSIPWNTQHHESTSEEDNDVENSLQQQQLSQQWLEAVYQNPDEVSVDSEDFKSLPAELQHELIVEMREERKWAPTKKMPQEAGNFSNFQLQNVLKRGKLNQRLEDLRKAMNNRNTGEVVGMTSQSSLQGDVTVESRRIVSEDTGHYILIKGSTRKEDGNEEGELPKNFEGEGGFFKEGEHKDECFQLQKSTKKVNDELPCSNSVSPVISISEVSPQSELPPSIIVDVSPEKNELSESSNLDSETEMVDVHVSKTDLSGNLEETMVKGEALRGFCSSIVDESLSNDGDSKLIEDEISQKKTKLEELVRKREKATSALTTERKIVLLEKISEEEENNSSTYQVAISNVTRSSHKGPSSVQESISKKANCEQYMNSNNLTEESVVMVKTDSGESENEHGESPMEVTISDSINKLQENDDLKVKKSDTIDERVLSSIEKGLEVEIVPDEKQQRGTFTVDGNAAEAAVVVIDDDVEDRDDIADEENTISVSNQKTDIKTTENKSPDVSPWQGVNITDNLEELHGTFEAEQKDLRTEKGRQERMAATVSNEMYSESQELLKLFGVPYMVSPMEAEAQCAMLDSLGLTHGSITNDSDIFLFGCSKVYKNFFDQGKHVELYQRESVERNLGLNRGKLVCLAFLTGSDYTEGVQGVGAVGAMEILNEFPGDDLEGLKKFKQWHDLAQKEVKPQQETKVKSKLRSVALHNGFPSEEVYEAYMKPVVDESTEPFEWAKPDLHSLRLYALEKMGWPRSKTDEILLPVLKQLNKQETQLKLDSFFPVRFEESRRIRSKRVKRVVNRLLTTNRAEPVNSDSSDNDEDQTKRRRKRKSAATTKPNQNKRACNKKRSQKPKSAADDSKTKTAKLHQGRSTTNLSGSSAKNVTRASVRLNTQENVETSMFVDSSSTSDDSSDSGEESGLERNNEQSRTVKLGQQKERLAWSEEPLLNVDLLPTGNNSEKSSSHLSGSVTTMCVNSNDVQSEQSLSNVKLYKVNETRRTSSDSDSTSSDSSAAEEVKTPKTRGVVTQRRTVIRGRGRGRKKARGRGRGRGSVKGI